LSFFVDGSLADAPEVDDRASKARTRYPRIYDLVRTIPTGEVATYGQIAFVAELSTPRMVGYAMAALPRISDPEFEPVPWHRVLNSQGRVSARRGGHADTRQRELLHDEGVVFSASGRIDFGAVAWHGPDWEWLESNGYDVGALIARSADLPRIGPYKRWQL
jgi:methylated-DNA-protein-cysteine methyltransferase-like protein